MRIKESEIKDLNIDLLFNVLKNYQYGTKTEVFEKGIGKGVPFENAKESVIQTPEEFDETKIGNSMDHTLYWVSKAHEAGLTACGLCIVAANNFKDESGNIVGKTFTGMHALPIIVKDGSYIYPETSLGIYQKVTVFSNPRDLIKHARNVFEPYAVEMTLKMGFQVDRMEVYLYDPEDPCFIGIDIDEFYKKIQEKGNLFEKYIPREEPTEAPYILNENTSKRQNLLLEKYLDKEIEPKKNKFETHSDDGFFELCRKKVLDDLLKDDNEKMEFYDFWMWCLDVGADDIVELTLHDLEDGNLSDDSHVKSFYDVYAHLKDEANKNKDAFLKQYSGGFENKMKKKFPDSFKDEKKKNEAEKKNLREKDYSKYDRLFEEKDFSKYDEAIKDALEKVYSEKSKVSLLEPCKKDEYGTIVYQVSGGLNGSGKWEDYFDALGDFVVELEKSGEYHTWLIDGNNDCLDDINYFNFGIRKEKSDKKEESLKESRVEKDKVGVQGLSVYGKLINLALQNGLKPHQTNDGVIKHLWFSAPAGQVKYVEKVDYPSAYYTIEGDIYETGKHIVWQGHTMDDIFKDIDDIESTMFKQPQLESTKKDEKPLNENVEFHTQTAIEFLKAFFYDQFYDNDTFDDFFVNEEMDPNTNEYDADYLVVSFKSFVFYQDEYYDYFDEIANGGSFYDEA